MTTQSTGSPKRRLVGILIALIALPVLALTPVFIADRFTTQSPSTDGQATIQPSSPTTVDQAIPNEEAVSNETPSELTEDDDVFVVVIDREFANEITDSDLIKITFMHEPNADDPPDHVVLLDTYSGDECEFALYFDSEPGNNETITGRIIVDKEMDRACAFFYGSELSAQ